VTKGRFWTVDEYPQTKAQSQTVLLSRGAVNRSDLIRPCCQGATGRAAGGPVLMHLGNLTAPRAALRLAVLPEVGPLASLPKKLHRFLETRAQT
jgi:hypothetical protein